MRRHDLFFLLSLLAFTTLLMPAAGCNRTPSAKRYALKGKIISIDQNAGMANIDAEAISGFMGAMVMPYTIKPASLLNQLQPGDLVTADIVVEPDKYWLQNVKVTGHSQPPAAKPTGSLQILSPGEFAKLHGFRDAESHLWFASLFPLCTQDHLV